MRAAPFVSFALFALTVLVACAPPNADAPIQQTATGLETQIAAIRRSATVSSERMQITVVGARSELEQIERNAASLRGTLTARGYDPAALVPATAASNATAQTLPHAAASPTPTLAITPPAPRPTSSPVYLSDFRIGVEIGDDDCVAAPGTALAATAPAIYTSARAQELPAGVELRTRWSAGGGERAVLTYTPDFAITDHCVWFFIDPSDTPFVPGNWEVRWELDGVAYPPQAFTITPN